MIYKELRIQTETDNLDAVVENLSTAGFTSLAIDDPEDLRDIEEHPEWYRYDYINEELRDESGRNPIVTLYFADDEEGRIEAARAEGVLQSLKDSLNKAYKKSLKDKAEAAVVSGTDKAARHDESAYVMLEWTLRETSDDREWLYKWQEHFKPTRVGKRIVVKPSWESYETEPEDIVIEMDPGMAFGSGLHETTTLCIRALEKILSKKNISATMSEAAPSVILSERSESKDPSELICSQNSLAAPRVLDIGTGTGILAIAAALLGASECLGIDIDEDAVRIARENVERNGLSDRIRIEAGDLLSSQSTADGVTATTQNANNDGEVPNADDAASHSKTFDADIIVANLMADLVIRLAPSAATRLKNGGVFISSGILDVKEAIVREAVHAAGFEITEVLHDGEWCAIVAAKK